MRIRRIMRAKRRQIIFLKSIEIVKVSLRGKKLLLNYNFFFESLINKIYIYLINTNFNFIIIRNNRILFLIISYYYRVNLIKEEYSINVENYSLIAKVDLIKNLIIINFINLLNLKSIIEKIKVNSFLVSRTYYTHIVLQVLRRIIDTTILVPDIHSNPIRPNALISLTLVSIYILSPYISICFLASYFIYYTHINIASISILIL